MFYNRFIYGYIYFSFLPLSIFLGPSFPILLETFITLSFSFFFIFASFFPSLVTWPLLFSFSFFLVIFLLVSLFLFSCVSTPYLSSSTSFYLAQAQAMRPTWGNGATTAGFYLTLSGHPLFPTIFGLLSRWLVIKMFSIPSSGSSYCCYCR